MIRLRTRPARGHGPDALATVPHLRHHPPEVVAALAPNVDRLRVRPGTVIAHQGWLVREVLFVLAGEVIATHADGSTTSTTSTTTTSRLGPGAPIGGDELLAGGRHPATLVAGSGLDVLVVYGPAYRWLAQVVR